jgi:exodeoxyribonuclease III
MRIFSWNVNGFRSAVTRGLMDWWLTERPDLLCLQETRTDPELLPAELRSPDGYASHWAVAERLGYSGVATFSRVPVDAWRAGLGIPRFDREGRVVVAELGDIEVYNVYVPGGARSPERFAYKLAFYDRFLDHIDARARAGKRIVFCGDLNAVRAPIDVARPVRGTNIPGIRPEERAWVDRCIAHGWVDAFRALHPDAQGAYTWWSTRGLLREQNIGWRLDAFFVHESLFPHVRGAGICPHVQGSDHCPVWIDIAL